MIIIIVPLRDSLPFSLTDMWLSKAQSLLTTRHRRISVKGGQSIPWKCACLVSDRTWVQSSLAFLSPCTIRSNICECREKYSLLLLHVYRIELTPFPLEYEKRKMKIWCDWNYEIYLCSPPPHFRFQSSTDLERNQWIESLTTSIMTGLNLRPQTLPRGGGSKTNNSKVCFPFSSLFPPSSSLAHELVQH